MKVQLKVHKGWDTSLAPLVSQLLGFFLYCGFPQSPPTLHWLEHMCTKMILVFVTKRILLSVQKVQTTSYPFL